MARATRRDRQRYRSTRAGPVPGGVARSVRFPQPPRATPWPDDHHPTPFQQLVIDAVNALGPGDLATYRDLAKQIGRPGAGQAVANVIRSAPDLPWWRVTPSDGRLYRTH